MKVLVIGGGGREHALVWKIRQSRLVHELFCSPGNAGIAEIADCPPLAASDCDAVADFVERQNIDLTVIGPEVPLAEGLVDRIHAAGGVAFGPMAAAARLESSKAFAKEFMDRHQIPTAKYGVFGSYDDAIDYAKAQSYPLVVKADGLAAGKGVIIAADFEQARDALHTIMKSKAFGSAGDRVVIEECLEGPEASFFAITDGRQVIPLVTSQDFKRAYDDDQGPNTGGMGAFSPARYLDRTLTAEVLERIVAPTIRGMAQEGNEYRGMLYVGLMLTADGPKVLEYNCRFGDPETQVVLPRLATDIVPMLMASAKGDLSSVRVEWKKQAAACVVISAAGYPGSYAKGKKISGLDTIPRSDEVIVFHAGTRAGPGGDIRTAGGRVLGITALGRTIADARQRAYETIDKIDFAGMHYRRDIALEAATTAGS